MTDSAKFAGSPRTEPDISPFTRVAPALPHTGKKSSGALHRRPGMLETARRTASPGALTDRRKSMIHCLQTWFRSLGERKFLVRRPASSSSVAAPTEITSSGRLRRFAGCAGRHGAENQPKPWAVRNFDEFHTLPGWSRQHAETPTKTPPTTRRSACSPARLEPPKRGVRWLAGYFSRAVFVFVDMSASDISVAAEEEDKAKDLKILEAGPTSSVPGASCWGSS